MIDLCKYVKTTRLLSFLLFGMYKNIMDMHFVLLVQDTLRTMYNHDHNLRG